MHPSGCKTLKSEMFTNMGHYASQTIDDKMDIGVGQEGGDFE